MLTFWNINHGLQTIDKWEPNCWVQVTCPSQDDCDFLENTLHVPDYFLPDIADTEERARYDIDEGWILIILRVPYAKERGLGFTGAVDLTFRLFRSSAVWYLKRLKQISTLIEKAKQDLDHKVSNTDLINFSRLQDSLTYFTTSIRGNETLLSKLKFKLPVDELDADLIEDVSIEMSQARETSLIYSNILDSTMDTYANVINNNMSNVMKMMTSWSIILMLPTLVASYFGMNLLNGMESSWYGFPLALLISFLLIIVFWWYFKRKSLF